MIEAVQVTENGELTLPSSLRERYGIQTGDTYRVIDFDGTFVLTPISSNVPELAFEIERMRVEAGVSTDELLEGLRVQRAIYVAERYGSASDGDAQGA